MSKKDSLKSRIAMYEQDITKTEIVQWAEHQVTKYILSLIEYEIDNIKESLAKGSCLSNNPNETAAKYNMKIGQVEGLSQILSLNLGSLQHMDIDEDIDKYMTKINSISGINKEMESNIDEEFY